jgi:hypothetical protein
VDAAGDLKMAVATVIKRLLQVGDESQISPALLSQKYKIINLN